MELNEYALKEKLAALEALILEKHPRMPQLLSEIHTVLRQQPENVVLLSEEEIALIVSGLKVHTGVAFAEAKKPKAKALKNVTADDL